MHPSVMQFSRTVIEPQLITDRRILEIGSYDVNGSVREIIECRNPSEYIGVDVNKGPGVDMVCDVDNLLDKFEPDSFDGIISTEVLEHVAHWWKQVYAIERLLKTGGWLLLTCRSLGFPYHPYDEDHWRYAPEDLSVLFSIIVDDVGNITMTNDPQMPGVFLYLIKSDINYNKKLRQYQNILRHRKIFNMPFGYHMTPLEWCDIHGEQYGLR